VKRTAACRCRCSVGGWATRGGREGGRRAGRPALSPALACLDKTHGTCGGISMRHHTWRKRQLNPAPSTAGPGSTKSSQHLEWISGDAADFTAPSQQLLTLTLKKKKNMHSEKGCSKNKTSVSLGICVHKYMFLKVFPFCTASHLLGIMSLVLLIKIILFFPI